MQRLTGVHSPHMTAQDVPTLDRAIRDYLACSRNRDMYDTEEDFLRAEQKWWDELQAAIAREYQPVIAEVTGDL